MFKHLALDHSYGLRLSDQRSMRKTSLTKILLNFSKCKNYIYTKSSLVNKK